jgi:hypothetical protein
MDTTPLCLASLTLREVQTTRSKLDRIESIDKNEEETNADRRE